MGMNSGIRIIGTGMYVPENVVTNEDFTKIIDTSDEWIVKMTGIKTRHIADGISTIKMGANAAADAVSNAGLKPEDIDVIIASTVSSDCSTPSLACLIANEIGAHSAVSFDINCACAGFVFALDLAKRYLSDGEYKNILIVSSEMLSRLTNYDDRSTCVLFGDGAGACVVQKSDNMYFSELGADTTGVKKLFNKGIEAKNPFSTKTYSLENDGFEPVNGHGIYMNGKEVYKFSTKIMPMAVEKACQKAGINTGELDLIVSHQANIRIIETAAKNLGLPMEKFFINIHKYGNTSSACIPICLHEAQLSGRVKRGDKICTVGFGAGLVYAASVFEW